MGNIVIVSDLHIGDRSKADDFFTSGNYLEFIRFVKWIEQNDSIDKLIIAGDLFELWQCKIEKALQMYIDVWKAFIRLTKSNKEVIYVPGNHDSLPFAKLAYKAAPFPIGSLKLTDQTDLDQKKKLIFPYYMESNLWIEHGHRFDKYNHASSELAGGSKGLLGRFIAKVVALPKGLFLRILTKNYGTFMNLLVKYLDLSKKSSLIHFIKLLIIFSPISHHLAINIKAILKNMRRELIS